MNKYNFKKKLVIGSANFTQKYGADLTKINRTEIKKIFNFAKKNNINTIDTADTYYTVDTYFKERDIFKKFNKTFQFIAKVDANEKWVSFDYSKKKIDEYFQIFNGNKVEALLFHYPEILLKNEGKKIFKNFEKLREKNYFENIGLSIYDPECLNHLVPKYHFDLIQCPFNILDRRIISSGWFDKLKKRGIEVHVRSIFLQGLFVNEVVYKKKNFKKWNFFFSEWFQNLKKNNIQPIDYCLSDLLDYNFDKIIVGINNCDNLKDVVNFKLIRNRDKMLKIKINDLNLIDPRNWKK